MKGQNIKISLTFWPIFQNRDESRNYGLAGDSGNHHPQNVIKFNKTPLLCAKGLIGCLSDIRILIELLGLEPIWGKVPQYSRGRYEDFMWVQLD